MPKLIIILNSIRSNPLETDDWIFGKQLEFLIGKSGILG